MLTGDLPSSSTASSPPPSAPPPPKTVVTEDNLLPLAQHLRHDAPSDILINKHQASLAAKRFWFMCYNLSQLPNPRPTPAQLSVAASVANLIAELSDDEVSVPILLRQSFTCAAKFAAVSTRLKAVWRLHKTEDWAAEDRTAVEKDTAEDAKELARRLPPPPPNDVADILSWLWSREAPVARDVSSSHDDAAAETEKEVLDWVRRRQIGAWRLPYEALRREFVPSAQEEDSSTRSRGGSQRRRLGGAEVGPTGVVARRGPCFVFRDGPVEKDGAGSAQRFFLGASPVVIQILESGRARVGADGAPDPHDLEIVKGAFADVQSRSLMDFVQDVVARVSWSHPHIVPYWGAFTEKVTQRGGLAPDPQLCLGMVLADPQLPSVLAEEPIPGAQATTTTTALHDLLFVQRRALPVGECVQLVAQVADALHYMLLGEIDDVPHAVLTAWCTISPANIFVTETYTTTTPPPSNPSAVQKTKAPADQGAGASGTDDEVFVAERPSHSGAENDENNNDEEDEASSHATTAKAQASPAVLHSRLVRVAPPCATTGAFFLHSRWEPHPHAASAPCYTLTQLLLALLTLSPPYRQINTQKALRLRVFEVPEDDPELIAEGLPVVRTSRLRGYTLPAVLPEPLKTLCTNGLRLISPRAAEEASESSKIASGVQQLQLWREQLNRMQAAMDAATWSAPLRLSDDPVYSKDSATHRADAANTTAVPIVAEGSTEMSSRGATADDVVLSGEAAYAADWFQYGIPSDSDEDS